MLVEQNADVPLRDGAVVRGNVYRPNGDGEFPVLMTFGPYGKDVPLREFMQEAWDRLTKTYPEILAASSCKHLVFERPDPEVWVPDGYVVIHVDSRGAGKSPGRLDPNSPAEFRDFYDAIEWAGTQPWSSGKVGLLGISYYAAGHSFVAANSSVDDACDLRLRLPTVNDVTRLPSFTPCAFVAGQCGLGAMQAGERALHRDAA